MKLLIVTQKIDINDDILGFMHSWVLELAKRCEQVIVVCLQKGEYRFPKNVRVLSLGKEGGQSKIKYISNFYKHLWNERKNYDTVFVHMNKEYVIMGGLFWRLTGKKIGLWYVHKKVSFQLILAELLAHVIFTSAKESFNLPSKKLKIVGHGIDLAKFSDSRRPENQENFKIIYVGRISRIKNQELSIKAVDILVNKRGFEKIKVDFIGATIYPEDEAYKAELIKFIKNNQLENYINFVGSVPNKDIAKVYLEADLSLNLCPTGGMDKAVLESLAAGLPVIVFNKAFATILNNHGNLLLDNLSEKELADKIAALINSDRQSLNSIGQSLREKIFNEYGASALMDKIIKELINVNTRNNIIG